MLIVHLYAANKLVRRTYWLDINDRIKLATNLGAPGAPELPCRLSGRLESSCSIFGCHGDGCLNVRPTGSSRSSQHRGSCGLFVWKLTNGQQRNRELAPTNFCPLDNWTADVAEPRVKLCGKFCPISEVCEEVATLPIRCPMPFIDLTRNEIWFLKALRRAAGERGRIVSAPASRAELAHLVEVQYVTEHPQSERKTLYIITDRGRQALANAP
jgi:hypothetical protein